MKYKVNISIIVFLYFRNNPLKNKFKSIPFAIASNDIKYLD